MSCSRSSGSPYCNASVCSAACPVTGSSAVARLLEEVRVEPGVTFIERGARRGLAVRHRLDGRVRVARRRRGTRRERPSGDVVGELAVLAPAPRSASVTALEPTLLLRLRRGPFEELLDDRPEIAARRDLHAGSPAAGVRRPRSSSGRKHEPVGSVAVVDAAHRSARWAGVLAGPDDGLDHDPGGRDLPRHLRLGPLARHLHRRGARRGSVERGARRRGCGAGPLVDSRHASSRRHVARPARVAGCCCRRSTPSGCRSGCSCWCRSSFRSASCFVVGQAGMLLDVRALKALYGRVVAGFALGFVSRRPRRAVPARRPRPAPSTSSPAARWPPALSWHSCS